MSLLPIRPLFYTLTFHDLLYEKVITQEVILISKLGNLCYFKNQ